MLLLVEGPGAAKALLAAPATADDFRNLRRLALFFIWQAYQDQRYIGRALHDPRGLPGGARLYYVGTSVTGSQSGKVLDGVVGWRAQVHAKGRTPHLPMAKTSG